jgi:hypothetical protein
MARPKTAQHVRPRRAAAFELDGRSYVLNPNHIYEADHEAVRAHPDLFVPLEAIKARPAVEAMTAAPGEQRGAAA